MKFFDWIKKTLGFDEDDYENDEFFLRAKRIEIPASITGVPFYLKMGYHFKDGISEPDEEHLIRMEKNK